MKVTGKVVKGIGESARFLAIDWVSKGLSERLKFSPFPGTLNVMVDDGAIQRMFKERGGERLVHREKGFCDAILIRGVINGKYECGVVLPLVENYNEKLLEVVAPLRLKDALNIGDGDEITLELSI